MPLTQSPPVRKLSVASARRIALAAQGFDRPRPARPPSVNQIAALVERLGLLQLDSVNVFTRAHYMPVFSRLGPYDRARLDRIAGHGTGKIDRRLIEYWAHEASLIPIATHPLFRWRMADVDSEAWGSISRIARNQPELVAETLELVADQGPIRARDTGAVRPPPQPGHMWNWHEGKVALEHLFFTGEIAAARRITSSGCTTRPTACCLPRCSACRRRARRTRSAISSGSPPAPSASPPSPTCATTSACRAPRRRRASQSWPRRRARARRGRGLDGARLPVARRRRPRAARRSRAAVAVRLADLVSRPHRAAVRLPLPDRDLHPAAKRVHGYYVLPFLLGETLVARVDLKSDRAARRAARPGRVRRGRRRRAASPPRSPTSCALVACWLGLDGVSVARNGDLSRELAAIIR